jgi:ABC-type transporter Mla maintaining outer membrane lipid asymmetry ATPase subunit MlaF
MAYDSFIIHPDLTFTVWRGDIFISMGGIACGKSTPLRQLSWMACIRAQAIPFPRAEREPHQQ